MQLLPNANKSKALRACGEAVIAGVPAVMWFIRKKMGNKRVAGMSMAQFRVLCVIDRFGDPSMSDVATYLGASVPTISRIVTGLVKRGYLQRTEATDDRRRCELALTPRGKAALKGVREEMREALVEQLAHLSAEDCGQITDSMILLSRIFPGEHTSLPSD